MVKAMLLKTQLCNSLSGYGPHRDWLVRQKAGHPGDLEIHSGLLLTIAPAQRPASS